MSDGMTDAFRATGLKPPTNAMKDYKGFHLNVDEREKEINSRIKTENREDNGNKIGGASRWNKGKVEVERVPTALVDNVAKVLTTASKKYPDLENGQSNWQQGLAFQGVIGCMERHLIAFKNGEDLDSDTGEHHLAHLACNVAFLLHFISTGQDKDLDNRMFKK